MIIGFTGTQRGLTSYQKQALVHFVLSLAQGDHQFHHGDCIGADFQATEIFSSFRIPLYCHPPLNKSKRAWGTIEYPHSHIYPAAPYLTRNHNIVKACHVLIACPGEFKEQLRSGTWATVRYAKKQRNVRVIVIYPDGSINVTNPKEKEK